MASNGSRSRRLRSFLTDVTFCRTGHVSSETHGKRRIDMLHNGRRYCSTAGTLLASKLDGRMTSAFICAQLNVTEAKSNFRTKLVRRILIVWPEGVLPGIFSHKQSVGRE